MNSTRTPFLTIGIASYNYGYYLNKAFEQIKKQKFLDYEILYCDDGSDDDSTDIIDRLINQNPNMQIRLIKGEHKGLLENKNRILDNANGKYIMICDADDYMLEDCLETLCGRALETNADMVVGGFKEIYIDGEEVRYTIPSTNSSKWIYIWHHGRIIKREFIEKYGIRFNFIPDDICLNQQMNLYSSNIVFVDRAVYVWNRHSSSTSVKIKPDDLFSPILITDAIFKFMENILNTEAKLDNNDIREIKYFMYKWYLLNITDLSLLPITNLEHYLNEMRKIQQEHFAEYSNIVCFINSLSTSDTFKARISVVLCWVIERLGLAKVMVCLRYRQMHKRKI